MDNSTNTHVSTSTDTLAANNEGNEYKLFFSVAGTPGKGGFPQHVWAAYLEDPQGKQVWANARDKAFLLDGHQFDALYIVVGIAMDKIPDGCTLAIFAPQQEVYSVYRVTREQRRADRYRDSKGKTRKRAEPIRALDDLAEQRGVTLVARDPELDHEYEMLEVARKDASARWTDACLALGSDF